MPKAAVNFETLALESLAQALADPAPKFLFGSAKAPGFFKGSTQAVKTAARLCEERGWLQGTGQWQGRGASKKQRYCITAPGIQAVLDQAESLVLLRSLAASLEKQVEQFQALRSQLDLLAGQAQPIAAAVTQLARKIEPPDVGRLVRQLAGAGSAVNPGPTTKADTQPPTVTQNWFDELFRLATEQRQRDRFQPLALPRIFASLRQGHPQLTLGQFHDGLRALRDQGRIRLAPYTRALATIDDPRNALFLDGEVMYYVELP